MSQEPVPTASSLIREIGLAMRMQGDDFVRSTGLSMQAGHTIGYIEAHQDRGVIQRELAEFSGRTPASVAAMLKGLEADGYIERRPNPDDVRSNLLYVLPKGQALIESFHRLVERSDAELLAPLTAEEQKTLLRLLTKVAAGFR